MNVGQQQADSMGGCAPCKAGKTTSPRGAGNFPPLKGKSVIVVDPEKDGWIGISLVDTKQHPVPNADFVVTSPGHEPVHGTLDAYGRARVEGVEPGTCKVEFPKIHRKDFS
jgi:hypothetical protein